MAEEKTPEEIEEIIALDFAQDSNTIVKSAQAQLLCMPGDTSYRLRSYGGDVEARGRSMLVASTRGQTNLDNLNTIPFPYDAIPIDAPTSLTDFKPRHPNRQDPIRDSFFSFFDHRENPDKSAEHITLRNQFGDSSWDHYYESLSGHESIWRKEVQGAAAILRYFKPSPNMSIQLVEISVPSPTENPEWLNYGLPKLLKYGSFNNANNILIDTFAGIIGTTHPELVNYSFLDTMFILNKPFVEAAYQESLGEKMGLSDPVKVQANYNFYLAPYEDILKDLLTSTGPVPLDETVLPNLYAIMVDAENTDNEHYKFKHADNWQYANKNMFVSGGGGDAGLYSWEIAINSPASAAGIGAKSDWAPLSGMPLKALGFVPCVDCGPVKYHLVGPGVGTHNEYLNTFAMRLKEVSDTAKDKSDTSLNHLAGPVESQKYKTTGISAYKIKNFTDQASRLKKFFPMHVDLEIPAANKGAFGKILYDSNMFDQFMQLIMAAMYPKHHDFAAAPSLATAIVKQDSFIKDHPLSPGKIDLSEQEDNLYYEPLISLGLNKLFEQDSMPDIDSFAGTYSFNFSTNAIHGVGAGAAVGMPSVAGPEVIDIVGKLNTNYATEVNADSKKGWIIKPPVFGKKAAPPVNWVSNIKWAINKNKINKFIEEKTRKVSDIYSGEPAYSEVLFYEVVKFRATSTGHAFVQNIFLPNMPGMEVLKYVDTQVKFDQEYYYQVYAHTFVVGTQYQVDMNNPPSHEEWSLTDALTYSKYKFHYKYAPSAHLIRAPYYNTYVTMRDAANKDTGTNPDKLEHTPIWDKPPVFPDILFLPLYGERNKILINSNFNVGEYELVPQTIEEIEFENEKKIRRNQKKIAPGTKITFRGDDFCGQIEVLRTDRKPLLWSDFKDSKIATLGGTSHFGQIIEQEPNKEYYYTARAKDKHGNYSNPSPIYQVIIIAKVGEAPYAIINMFFMDETEEKKPVKRKNLMKYIRIQPSFDQSFLDDSKIVNTFKDGGAEAFKNSGDLEKYLGKNVDHTVFVQPGFKFRFTSKKTGKKFDLNVVAQNPGFSSVENKTTKGAQDDYSSGKC